MQLLKILTEDLELMVQRKPEPKKTKKAECPQLTQTRRMFVDFRKQQREHPPIHIDGTVVERVVSFKFLGVHITDKLNSSTHTDSVVKKA